jgi:hypothetical protein
LLPTAIQEGAKGLSFSSIKHVLPKNEHFNILLPQKLKKMLSFLQYVVTVVIVFVC